MTKKYWIVLETNLVKLSACFKMKAILKPSFMKKESKTLELAVIYLLIHKNKKNKEKIQKSLSII
jgi:hypothetical protein